MQLSEKGGTNCDLKSNISTCVHYPQEQLGCGEGGEGCALNNRSLEQLNVYQLFASCLCGWKLYTTCQ